MTELHVGPADSTCRGLPYVMLRWQGQRWCSRIETAKLGSQAWVWRRIRLESISLMDLGSQYSGIRQMAAGSALMDRCGFRSCSQTRDHNGWRNNPESLQDWGRSLLLAFSFGVCVCVHTFQDFSASALGTSWPASFIVGKAVLCII